MSNTTATTQTYEFAANVMDKLPELPPDTIISRALAGIAPFKTLIFGFAAGQELLEHTTARPALLYFIQGEATVTLDSQSFDAQPGTLIAMEPNLPHSIVAHTATQMLLIQADPPRSTTSAA